MLSVAFAAVRLGVLEIPELPISTSPRDSPALQASGWVSARYTCDKVVRSPDEHPEI
jgi:hypothetical protein